MYNPMVNLRACTEFVNAYTYKKNFRLFMAIFYAYLNTRSLTSRSANDITYNYFNLYVRYTVPAFRCQSLKCEV